MFKANASLFSSKLGHVQDISKVTRTYEEARALTFRWEAYAVFLELKATTWLVELDQDGKPVK